MELEPDAPLPFDDGAFDLVLCAETIEHVRDVQLLLSEIRRVLPPGGALALTTPAHLPFGRRPDPMSPHLRFFTRRSLRRLLDELGFEVESLRRSGGTLLRARYSLSPGCAVPAFSRSRARASRKSWRAGFECGFR